MGELSKLDELDELLSCRMSWIGYVSSLSYRVSKGSWMDENLPNLRPNCVLSIDTTSSINRYLVIFLI